MRLTERMMEKHEREIAKHRALLVQVQELDRFLDRAKLGWAAYWRSQKWYERLIVVLGVGVGVAIVVYAIIAVFPLLETARVVY